MVRPSLLILSGEKKKSKDFSIISLFFKSFRESNGLQESVGLSQDCLNRPMTLAFSGQYLYWLELSLGSNIIIQLTKEGGCCLVLFPVLGLL